jgi:rare lipoprotein A
MRSAISLFALLLAASSMRGQENFCESDLNSGEVTIVSSMDLPGIPQAEETSSLRRLLKYASVEARHRLNGLASYYSTSLDGTLTANGEIYRNRKISAAHLTLPLGSWVEVRSRATGKKVRLRVNDRGPYVNKFCLDLSQAAARSIGVDVAEDRTVNIRLISMPGASPLPDEVLQRRSPRGVCENPSAEW